MTPGVKLLMWMLSPVAWPTAKLLDYVLGDRHRIVYKKAGLKTLVQMHRSLGTRAERLIDDEVTIISSALELKEKTVADVMTPIEDVFTLSADTVLDEKVLADILSNGYSRIPVYVPGSTRNFEGMLLVKSLIGYDPHHPEARKRVRDLNLGTLPETPPSTSCLDIINFFQEGKSHMALVSTNPGKPYGGLGVVTLEDVMEELLGEEIIDESDIFIDVHRAIRRIPTTTSASQPSTSDVYLDHHHHYDDVEMTSLLRSSSDGPASSSLGTVTESMVVIGDKERPVLQSSMLDDRDLHSHVVDIS